MNNDEQAKKYLKWINNNYDAQKKKLMAFCNDKRYKWDEDVFCETYLKIYDRIIRNGIKDDSESGFDGYTFMSFKQNLIREQQYSRNAKRDRNVTNLATLNEEFQNTKLTQEEKLYSDLKKDFFTLYLMKKVEDNFSPEHFYLFRLKTFSDITYSELAKKTGIKGARQKVTDVKNWLRENVTKAEIDKAFDAFYSDDIC